MTKKIPYTFGNSNLFYAAETGQLDLAREYLDKGANLDKEYDEIVAALEGQLKDRNSSSWKEVNTLLSIFDDLLDVAEEEGFKTGFLKGMEIGAGKTAAALLAGGAV